MSKSPTADQQQGKEYGRGIESKAKGACHECGKSMVPWAQMGREEGSQQLSDMT